MNWTNFKKMYLMKKFLVLVILMPIVAFTQSKKELEDDLKSTKAKLDSFQTLYFQQQSQYQQKIVFLESIIDKVKFVLGSTLPPNNSFSTLPNQTIGNNNVESIKSQIGDVKQNTPLKLGEGDGLTPKTSPATVACKSSPLSKAANKFSS